MLTLLLQILFYKWVARGYFTVCGMMLLLVLITKNNNIHGCFILLSHSVYFDERIHTGAAEVVDTQKNIQNILAFLGIFVICLFGINDILYANGIYFWGSSQGRFKPHR